MAVTRMGYGGTKESKTQELHESVLNKILFLPEDLSDSKASQIIVCRYEHRAIYVY
jgi:hypothetical protein